MTKPERIATYIREHGFDAEIAGESVTFLIPCTKDGKPAGYIRETVTTIKEAREALGY